MEEYSSPREERFRSKHARRLYREVFSDGKSEKEQENLSPSSPRYADKPLEPMFFTRCPRDYSPSVEDLLEFYKSNGLVGEERIAILQTFGAIRKLSFGIEGASGSGKSFAADLLMKLLPRSYVYRIELSSNTAEIYNADEINRAKIIYIPELQKAFNSRNPIMIEVLKNLTEGRDVIRRVRDQEKRDNILLNIIADKGIIYTLATENELKKDVELSRRVFQLETDTSKEQSYRVIDKIVEKSYLPREGRIEFSELKAHIRECLDFPNAEYVNPFSRAALESVEPTVKARSFVKHYLNLIQGSTLFYHKERVSSERRLFTNLEDFFLVHSLFNEQFLRSVSENPERGVEKMEHIQGREVDWMCIWNLGVKTMLEFYPGLLDEWQSSNIRDAEISVFDILKGERKILGEF